MVRETRHLWVGNLPDNIREDRIREHFKRYGRVQNVKLLGRTENPSTATSTTCGATNSGICATVAFMDIKSASKAHNAEHVLDECTFTTEYYEPAAIPTTAGAPSAGSSPAGSGYSGSSSSVISTPAPGSNNRYHTTGSDENSGNACLAASAAAPANWRGTNDSASEYCRRGNTPATYGRYQRNSTTAPYATPPSNVERSTPVARWYASGDRGGGATGGESTPSTPGGGTESGCQRRHSGSASSRSESSSPEPSDNSRSSTPAPTSTHPLHANHRTPTAHPHQWASTVNGRPLAICVRNLPTRSTDSSLKDGLYHEYKKHGKVVWVKVVGQNADRYAVVRFKKPSDVEKALEVSQDKLFFGCKISVAPHQSCDEDADSAKPYETDIDEYHPKATRTLFIGNLEKDVTQQQLREKFKHFGRIIEIDIKKGSGGGAGYAFCQYATISSVVEAIRAMDGEHVGGSRVKLGFGKPVATTCVWVDGLTEHTEKQVLGAVSRCGEAKSVCVDRAAGAALVHFEQVAAAGAAVRELRRVAAQLSALEADHPRLCVDYASRECQEAFYEQLEKHGGSTALTGSDRLSGDVTARYVPPSRHDPIRYDGSGSRSRGSSYSRCTSRNPRYLSLDHYDPAEYAADRRYRVFDELTTSPQTEELPFDERLQSVVVSPHRARRHRRDSSPEERKHSKERHWSSNASGVSARRSRSGSRGVERHLSRRRHRRRREGSRAGTPLRDEPDAPPTEPRRPPRERPPLPMSLPLPKFAAQLLRAVPAAPRPAAAPAPASPPRPPSASSSSGGSAPHSPSLEERIRSLDEKYEKWNGSRVLTDAPDRSRLRHRLLEIDINEVKPSDVVISLLSKRSVFDEDSERLEGARVPSPASSPRSRPSPCVPRALRYPFPSHNSQSGALTGCSTPLVEGDSESSDRSNDPRLHRLDRHFILQDKATKSVDIEYNIESKLRLRTPSIEKSQSDTCDQKSSASLDRDRHANDQESKQKSDVDRRRRNSLCNDVGSFLDSFYKDKESAASGLVTGPAVNNLDSSSENRNDNIRKQNSTEITSLSDIKIESGTYHDIIDTAISKPFETSLVKTENECKPFDKITVKYEPNLDIQSDTSDLKFNSEVLKKCENSKIRDFSSEILVQNCVKNEISDYDIQKNYINALNSIKTNTDFSFFKNDEKCLKEGNHSTLEVKNQNIKIEKENIKVEEVKKDGIENVEQSCDKKGDEKIEKDINISDQDTSLKNQKCDSRYEKDCNKSDQDTSLKNQKCDSRYEKDCNKSDQDTSLKNQKCDSRYENDKDKSKVLKVEKLFSYHDNNKKHKDEILIEKLNPEKEKLKTETDLEQTQHKEKIDLENKSRQEHKKEKVVKEKRKDSYDLDFSCPSKLKKDEKIKHDKLKKDSYDLKRDSKKENEKCRKHSRDDSSREISRKDSTDSSTSKTSHDYKVKELDCEIKDEDQTKSINISEDKCKLKKTHEHATKHKSEKETKSDGAKLIDMFNTRGETKEDKQLLDQQKNKNENCADVNTKSKGDLTEKQRHYSLDSPNIDSKRKERLSSCSSLPSQIGNKRRMSSQDSLDLVNDDTVKKAKNESKVFERRDSKDSRSERHKTTKFSKGHFAKIIESKTKDDKKNQVKTPDDSSVEWIDNSREIKTIDKKPLKRSPKDNEKLNHCMDVNSLGLHNDLNFLAILELRSSEEDEKQRALRKEMKEKKRIQQLQQIQQFQMQQDALQHAEFNNKLKEDKRNKETDKKRETVREKRISTDRKSRDEKLDNNKRKNRKNMNSTDTSDSDEPKKHSIFDIIDDGPTYISMYDKVKARSCKNMQKQEEEKRQEKIKAKFSQLKQSRAKREEKKRSSWDEDSDSDVDRRKPVKSSIGTSSDDEQINNDKKSEGIDATNHKFDLIKNTEYFNIPSNDDEASNKLSRKNSRTRIISDSSDETSKRSISPSFHNDSNKSSTFDCDTLKYPEKQEVIKEKNEDKVKKHSLLNLFGKSDSDDSRLKSGIEMNKSSFMDFSSESETAVVNRHNTEFRRKHKKKQKKHKFSVSDDDKKCKNDQGDDEKRKQSQKPRRHSTKKEKRKEKNRDSFDTDDARDEKFRNKNQNMLTSFFETSSEITASYNKREGKMEDIFGPLSDDSDQNAGTTQETKVISTQNYDSTLIDQSVAPFNNEEKRNKEEKRKKEKRRKDKRHFVKDDENSLDVDAVSKAIEARLFADSLSDYDNCQKSDLSSDITKPNKSDVVRESDNSMLEDNNKIVNFDQKHIEKIRRESKEKKKKKKKNKEDRQHRKDQNSHIQEKNEKVDCVDNTDYMQKTILSDIPLPKDIQIEKPSELKPESSSVSSLPILTGTPPLNENPNKTDARASPDGLRSLSDDSVLEIDFAENKMIEVDEIPMPPSINNIVEDISKVPLPEEPEPLKNKISNDNDFMSLSGDVSETAVRSISNSEHIADKVNDSIDTHITKNEEKIDEKPRAVISQEETEDAVAALLGESFGEKNNIFEDCYDQVESTAAHEICNSTTETANIPEEDAEEMRRAVQNLNASEMEIKPDTPLSDNDLLLIDTDTEDADDNVQDSIEKLTVNMINSNQLLSSASEKVGAEDSSSAMVKTKSINSTNVDEKHVKVSQSNTEKEQTHDKSNAVKQIISTATPVITSWSLTNHIVEPQKLNIQKSIPRTMSDNNTIHNANDVQVKTPVENIQSSLRPMLTQNRLTAPYQVINQMIRPTTVNIPPPTIKIPEPHILYQKPPGIVLSPRLSTDPRLHSSKTSNQGESITSPRSNNMTILSSSPPNLNSIALPSPSAIPQRSPGQVTVVRMQQPPLSPIQTMHLPHVRTMLSPTRPNSVLVQTQGASIHLNRLPVTPVLAPISKQINTGNPNLSQHVKGLNISNSALLHQQKILTEGRKTDVRLNENVIENSKIILSSTNFQQSTNPTVLAQNRLISMQNTMHISNLDANLHLPSKLVINSMNPLNERKDVNKNEKHLPFIPTSIIHVTGVNHSTVNIPSGSKPIMCTLQEAANGSRGQGANVIHTLSPRRIISAAPVTNNMIQIDSSKASVLSMPTIASPTVVTNFENTKTAAVTTASLKSVVMTPLLLKNGSISNFRIHSEGSYEMEKKLATEHDDKNVDKNNTTIQDTFNIIDVKKFSTAKETPQHENTIAKCETDFEELLKDNTNEIKLTNDPEKKLEVNVGKTVTLIAANTQVIQEIDSCKLNTSNINKPVINFELRSNDKENNTSEFQSQCNNSDIKEMPIITNNNYELKTEVNNVENATDKSCMENNMAGVIDEKSINMVEQSKPEEIVLLTNDDNKTALINNENLAQPINNIGTESVIKKLQSVNIDKSNESADEKLEKCYKIEEKVADTKVSSDSVKEQEVVNMPKINSENDLLDAMHSTEKTTTTSKRGGRSLRGRKAERNTDRIQTRQIAKPTRGISTKRGRGRAKVDKRSNSLVNSSVNNIPGDVYDFHEDSGDEAASQKSEVRPRLILTIKSPLSGNSNVLATSTLSITQKDEQSNSEKNYKEEKLENFILPSSNTRKSRRLQEKDVQKNVPDDPLDDAPKTCVAGKLGKKRATRQMGTKVNNKDKVNASDTRKSPRGVKRTRDRSLSDASAESSDEKSNKKEDAPTESKTMKLSEPDPIKVVSSESRTLEIIQQIALQVTTTTPQITHPISIPTPITKPPKKMISEISAKLASVFEATANQQATCRTQHTREPECALPTGTSLLAGRGGEAKAATGESRFDTDVEEARFARRVVEATGAEAREARVQSPALPHLAPRVLAREWDEGEARRYGASLPRGAHHPPPAPAPSPSPAPLQPRASLHAKQVAVVGPHHHQHLPGVASRVTITSVPAISPQGQMPLPAELVRSPPPAHQHTSPVTPVYHNGDGLYYSHQHYQMYQQHFHATQHENRAASSPYVRSLEEGCEAPTPPLELRRPPSARVPRPAHSPSPADRHILYAAGCGRSPPPAHGTSRLPAALPPLAQPGPPHASVVPSQADSLQMLLSSYPVIWQGLLALKNDSAAVQMHFVGGNMGVASDTLQRHADGSTPPLRIAQRMRLEPMQLDQVLRKMKMENEHCILLALPCGRDHMDVLQQSNNLTAGFITYLQSKQAAGIVNVAQPGHHQAMYTVHIFPSCDFANENLNRIAPDLMHRVKNIAHLLIVIATV